MAVLPRFTFLYPESGEERFHASACDEEHSDICTKDESLEQPSIMAEKEKKRKRQESADAKPSKRAAISPSATLSFSYTDGKDKLHPVLGSSCRVMPLYGSCS